MCPVFYRVPDLQFNLLAIHLDHAGAELHTNRQVVRILELLFRELQQQRRLTNLRVADHDVLERQKH